MKTISVIDIGETVVCDLCNEDFTNSAEEGGFLFQSKGVCPRCSGRFEEQVRKYDEQEFIRDRARPGETFKAFCLRQRGGDNRIIISEAESVEDFFG